LLLRYYATGTFQLACGDLCDISRGEKKLFSSSDVNIQWWKKKKFLAVDGPEANQIKSKSNQNIFHHTFKIFTSVIFKHTITIKLVFYLLVYVIKIW
jgi:hypothetical protein